MTILVLCVQGGAAVEYSTPATERRYNIYPAGSSPGVPRGTSHLHRNVAAFGEITVMPVGEATSDSENVRVAVDEELL